MIPTIGWGEMVTIVVVLVGMVLVGGLVIRLFGRGASRPDGEKRS
jgi:hypothetical protein